MSDPGLWAWTALFLLGVYHGVNPGMGWLFAVALGMQEKSGRAVGRSLLPIATGHAAAIGLVILIAGVAGIAVPLRFLKVSVAVILCAFGLYRLWRHRHPRWVGMQVGFGDLVVWSFLMASAHGAGLMVLPVLFGMSAGEHASHAPDPFRDPLTGLLATLVHTVGYLIITGLVAWVVYEKFGLALLRRAWLNLDRVWAIALIATGGFTLLI